MEHKQKLDRIREKYHVQIRRENHDTRLIKKREHLLKVIDQLHNDPSIQSPSSAYENRSLSNNENQPDNITNQNNPSHSSCVISERAIYRKSIHKNALKQEIKNGLLEYIRGNWDGGSRNKWIFNYALLTNILLDDLQLHHVQLINRIGFDHLYIDVSQDSTMASTQIKFMHSLFIHFDRFGDDDKEQMEEFYLKGILKNHIRREDLAVDDRNDIANMLNCYLHTDNRDELNGRVLRQIDLITGLIWMHNHYYKQYVPQTNSEGSRSTEDQNKQEIQQYFKISCIKVLRVVAETVYPWTQCARIGEPFLKLANIYFGDKSVVISDALLDELLPTFGLILEECPYDFVVFQSPIFFGNLIYRGMFRLEVFEEIQQIMRNNQALTEPYVWQILSEIKEIIFDGQNHQSLMVAVRLLNLIMEWDKETNYNKGFAKNFMDSGGLRVMEELFNKYAQIQHMSPQLESFKIVLNETQERMNDYLNKDDDLMF